jgi:hypothetical protein
MGDLLAVLFVGAYVVLAVLAVRAGLWIDRGR